MKAPETEAAAERILETAGTVFAERGYEGTTIREITTRACVNVAAVHYYFGDKDRLYARVLQQACVASKIEIDDLPGAPAARLSTFISKFIHYLLQPGRPSWHARVMTLEMSNPTPALDEVIEETIRPLCEGLRHLLRELAGPGFSPVEIELLSSSIMGQCLYYVQKGPLIERIYPHVHKLPHRNERIARHITDFTLSAIEGLRKKEKS
jgi:AcrR family transcriptional regulator